MELKIRCKKATKINCTAIFFIAIVSVIYSQIFLKGEWRGTPSDILSYVKGREITELNSATISAMFFRLINIFSLETLLSWRIYLEFIFNISIYIYCISNEKVYTKTEYLYLFFLFLLLMCFLYNLVKK